MKVLSHRGYWTSVEEKNTEFAFERSFALGFGTETDVRDRCGELVISHDMPDASAIRFARLLEIAVQFSSDQSLTLALNIKADGLVEMLQITLRAFSGLDCFVFDMSVPDMRSYINAGIPVFTRMSEVEQEPAWLEQSAGVWLDGFESEWYTEQQIEALLSINKRVCVVSPELHKRPHMTLWKRLKSMDHRRLLLCTDFPEEASAYFLKP
ncbi:MAG: phosphodiesterase [Burkholderiales bacterium]|jgi:glycerophosphoryl diester phosphodiesterase|nr:phosphodiesterase [Burkholderiales bacterium]